MTNQQDTALLPVGQIKRALELWFFRELSDEQRRSLFRLAYGDRYASEATTHGHQSLSLRRVLRDIAAEQAKPSASCEAGEVERLRKALKPFADCCDQIGQDEDDEEWAKFRLLIKDYRRARAAMARLPSDSDGDSLRAGNT